jgi:hypothetical protein
MTNLVLFEWFIAGTSLVGTIINMEYKNKYCFALWLPANFFFMVRDFQVGMYAQSALMGIYVLIAIRGLMTWK